MEPNISELLFTNLCDKVIEYLVSLNMCKRTIDNYRYVLKKLKTHFSSSNTIFYQKQLIIDFIKCHNYQNKSNDPGHMYYKTCMLLIDIAESKTPRNIYYRSDFEKEENKNGVVEEYILWLKKLFQSDKTINTKISRIKNFINYIEDNDININEITSIHILTFLNVISNQFNNTYRYNIETTLKDFLGFLYDSHIINLDLRLMIGKLQDPKHSSIQSTYTIEEIQTILDSIDTSSEKGIRNFLIVYMISSLGLRAFDVSVLKLSDIGIVEKTLKINMHKTNKPLELPLTDNIINLIVEYLSIRQKLEIPYLFIRDYQSRNSHPLTSSAISAIVSKCIKESNIKINGRKHGAHSLRHSVATNLMNNGVEIPVISYILGHSSTDTTRIYARTSLEQLRTLSLEVPVYEG